MITSDWFNFPLMVSIIKFGAKVYMRFINNTVIRGQRSLPLQLIICPKLSFYIDLHYNIKCLVSLSPALMGLWSAMGYPTISDDRSLNPPDCGVNDFTPKNYKCFRWHKTSVTGLKGEPKLTPDWVTWIVNVLVIDEL